MISITLSRSDWKLLCWQLRQPADVAQFPRLKSVIEKVESHIGIPVNPQAEWVKTETEPQIDLEEYLDRSCDE